LRSSENYKRAFVVILKGLLEPHGGRYGNCFVTENLLFSSQECSCYYYYNVSALLLQDFVFIEIFSQFHLHAKRVLFFQFLMASLTERENFFISFSQFPKRLLKLNCIICNSSSSSSEETLNELGQRANHTLLKPVNFLAHVFLCRKLAHTQTFGSEMLN
jgi:hypothetical protein